MDQQSRRHPKSSIFPCLTLRGEDSTYLIRRVRRLDVSHFHPPFDQVDRHGGVEAQKRVRGVEKSLLLVRLSGEHPQPDIEWQQSQREQRVGAGLPRPRRLLRLAQTTAVVHIRNG